MCLNGQKYTHSRDFSLEMGQGLENEVEDVRSV